MSLEILDAALDWLESAADARKGFDLTFHGGEPLLAGLDWFEAALPRLRNRFGCRLRLAVQSNLWQMDEAFCGLFREFGVSVGTSLDGPADINDSQRGSGYFARTMAGIEAARRCGLNVGVICTFTTRSSLRHQEVMEFFAREGLPVSFHEAIRRLGDGCDSDLALSPEEHAGLAVSLLDQYLADTARLRISSFDAMARGVASGEGHVCTFRNCLGNYIAIAANGDLFPCNRFMNHPEWRLGSVREHPAMEALKQAQPWRVLETLERNAQSECGDCVHFPYCRGGCHYNSVVAKTEGRDPHCKVYRALFSRITECALQEVFLPQNLRSIVDTGTAKHGLLQEGALLQIMRGGPHPADVIRRAREVVAAAALGTFSSPAEALGALRRLGIVARPEVALSSLESLARRVSQRSQRLGVAYLHLTYVCNLKCSHCYISAGDGAPHSAVSVERACDFLRQATVAGFEKVAFTGGEPLAHPERDALLDALLGLHPMRKRPRMTLRTNLALPLTQETLLRLAMSVDEIVVSLDGDRLAHEHRRGKGSYDQTVSNLTALMGIAPRAEVCLAAIMSSDEARGAPGAAVRALAKGLGVGVRFRALLPIGRGASLTQDMDVADCLHDGVDALSNMRPPTGTCGLGANLFVGPDGDCYPCHAFMGPQHGLGNVWTDGLPAVLERNDGYRDVTVNSNQTCRLCALRYVCGGFCRAWRSGTDANSPPRDCARLQKRARRSLACALEALEITPEQWRAAGLAL
jgi:uncharacterized protein